MPISGSMVVRSNPFHEIEKSKFERQLYIVQREKHVKSVIRESFHEWDMIIFERLRQLAHALVPQTHQKPYLNLLRKITENNWMWAIFGDLVSYRIVRKREEGKWRLEIFCRGGCYGPTSNGFVQIGLSLDEKSNPGAFHLRRGSDNKVFVTRSLSDEELSNVLVCHFSRLSCGSEIQEDLRYLDSLHKSNIITTPTYVAEKKNLNSELMQAARLYTLPSKPAQVVIAMQVRHKRLFTSCCVILLVLIFCFALAALIDETPPYSRNDSDIILNSRSLHIGSK